MVFNTTLIRYVCISTTDTKQNNRVRAMVFNITFNNISVISWQSILLVEETTDLPQVTDKLYHKKLHWIHLAWAGFELTMLVVIGTDCIGSYKSNYHTITNTTAPILFSLSYVDNKLYIYGSYYWPQNQMCDKKKIET